jgi:hypothetical protein
MPDFVIIMICKATNTSEQKISVFYLTGRPRKLDSFPDERNFTHQWNTNLLGNKTHGTLITVSPVCVCQGDNVSSNALVTLEAMNVRSKILPLFFFICRVLVQK